MTKELKFLAPLTGDPYERIACAIVAVEHLNGHQATDDEIVAVLTKDGAEPSIEDVDRVRAAVARAQETS